MLSLLGMHCFKKYSEMLAGQWSNGTGSFFATIYPAPIAALAPRFAHPAMQPTNAAYPVTDKIRMLLILHAAYTVAMIYKS